MTALLVAAGILALLVVMLARLGRVLDEAELRLRTLAGQVRAVRRAAESYAPLADDMVRDTAAGEATLARLQALKTGEHRRRSANFRQEDGVGPVSLPMRPSPSRLLRPPPAPQGRQGVERSPDQRGRRRP
jgi:hypothetical protein